MKAPTASEVAAVAVRIADAVAAGVVFVIVLLVIVEVVSR